MQKPTGYDETRAGGDFTPINLGGHYCTIKQVTETETSKGKPQIVVLLDFADQDDQTGYFANQFNNDDRPEKKWPFAGSKWITIPDYNNSNKTSRAFKTFCTCVEKSNNYQIQWGGNNWGAQFKGKKIGAVYGQEEHEYNGEISKRNIIRWFCNWDAVKDAKIPEFKPLPNVFVSQPPMTTEAPFSSIPEGVEEEIPF